MACMLSLDDLQSPAPGFKPAEDGAAATAAMTKAASPAELGSSLKAVTKEDQARAAFAEIAKPVTETSFVAWYCRTHNKRKVVDDTLAPPAKKQQQQGLMPGASAPASGEAAASALPKTKSAPASGGGGASAAAGALPKAKKNALLKGIVTSLKANAKAERWHGGDVKQVRAFDSDVKTVTGSLVMDHSDFTTLFKGVQLSASSGVLTTFTLSNVDLGDLFGEALTSTVKVPTFSLPRSFQKAYKTGIKELSFTSAEGKYSKGTSTLTLKFSAVCGGGGGMGGCFFGDDDDC